MNALQEQLVSAGVADTPREDSPEPLDAPPPLPHVSRRALKRVKNPLPLPDECPYCEGTPRIVSNAEIYGREYGEWPYTVLCDGCGAYVGLHPHTDVPLGTLADRNLREARKKGKGWFMKLQRKRGMSRNSAYQWLSDQLGIGIEECHWAWFDEQQCNRAEGVCIQALRDDHRWGSGS